MKNMLKGQVSKEHNTAPFAFNLPSIPQPAGKPPVSLLSDQPTADLLTITEFPERFLKSHPFFVAFGKDEA